MYFVFIAERYYPNGGAADYVVPIPAALPLPAYLLNAIRSAIRDYIQHQRLETKFHDSQFNQDFYVTILDGASLQGTRWGFILEFRMDVWRKVSVEVKPLKSVKGLGAGEDYVDMALYPGIQNTNWVTLFGFNQNSAAEED